jgi:hypothetical protein
MTEMTQTVHRTRANSTVIFKLPHWTKGNFHPDTAIDGHDLFAWNANKFTSSADASAVPEPVSRFGWLIAGIVIAFLPRR